MKRYSFLFVLFLFGCTATTTSHKKVDVLSLTASEMAAGIRAGNVSSEQIVQAYLARIEQMDRQGPSVQSIIALNPNALKEARQRDEEVRQGKVKGELHGVPFLVKDNIETRELPTTAGSLALASNDTKRDAPIIAGLRAQGAIVLGKANLSEWANFRSNDSISGWSGIGGQTRNPHSLDRSACGSSSGSGAAIAAQFAPLAIGTETNGSIMCPSAMNGIVGFKPTVGLLSRTHIVPISSTQDTAGPMTRTVKDAAMMLSAMAGSDAADPATAKADKEKTNYAAALTGNIKGMRIGVMRFAQGNVKGVTSAFEEALKVLEKQGAVLVDIDDFSPPKDMWPKALKVLETEFKVTLNHYLANSAQSVKTRSLSDLIEFNNNNSRETALFDQSLFLSSEKTKGLQDPDYVDALNTILSATREQGIDKMLAEHNVSVLVMPSRPPTFLIDAVYGDSYPGGSVGAGWLAAIAGYPIVTVPMGEVKGLPIGFGVIGKAWDDANVLNVGFAYEQASNKIILPSFAKGPFDLEQTKAAMRPHQ